MGNRVAAGVPIFCDDGSMVLEPTGRISAVGGGGGGPPTGPASGDLSGVYPGPTVDGLQGVPISAVAATAGQYYVLTGGTWVATTPPAALPPNGAASGDLSGSYPGPLVDGLQGRPVAAAAPALNQVLAWDGAQWLPTTIAAGGTVTNVTATLPLTSSGGATPNLALTAGADAGDVYSWNGAAFDLAERIVRVQGALAPTGNLTLDADAGSVLATPSLDFQVTAGNEVIMTSAGNTTIGATGNTILRRNGGAQIWLTGVAEEHRFGGSADFVWVGTWNPLGANLVSWANSITSLTDIIEAKVAAGAGAPRVLAGQDAGTGAGGSLTLRSGAGSTVPGDILINQGPTTVLSIASATSAITLGAAAFAGIHRINTSVSTSASPGGETALPATPAGYWDVNINGTDQRIPFFN